jgi:hypothetical protein
MIDLKKENINFQSINAKDQAGLVSDENVTIHTMQGDLDALSGIFPKNEKPVLQEEKKNEGIPNNKEKIKDEQYFNPFLDKNPPKNQEKIADFANKKNIPIDNTLLKQEAQMVPESKASNPKIIWIAAGVVVVAAFSLGGYYFWTMKKISVVPENKTETTPEANVGNNGTPAPVETEPVSKYSTDKPNYLSIDTENPSSDAFKKTVNETFSGIKEANIDKPVEFIVTDNKNNPVAFSVLAAINKLGLSDGIMKNLGDTFSLFIYSDSGNLRLSLLIGMNDQAGVASAIKTEEAKLPGELAPLFMEGITLPKVKVAFKDSTYKELGIRYFNFNNNPLSSIDYVLLNNKLVIGTSRGDMWATLDNILSNK